VTAMLETTVTVDVPTARLRAALDVVHAFTGRTYVPILGAVVLTSDGSRVSVEAFDYDTSARIPVGESAHMFRVAVDRVRLRDVVRGHDRKGTTTVHVAGERMTVSQGAAQTVLPTMTLDGYPQLPATTTAPLASVDASILVPAVKRALTACARDDTLPVLCAVAVTLNADGLEMAATDRYRLTAETVPAMVDPTADTRQLLIPGKILGHVVKALAGDVLIGAEDSYAVIATDAGTFTIRLTEGEFPKYASLFPVNDGAVSLDVKATLAALKRVAVACERNAPVRLTFTGDAVTLRGGTFDASEPQATETVRTLTSVADELTVGVNPRNLRDALTAATGPAVVLGYVSPTKPLTFHAPGDTSFRNLLMPVRLSG
jgi:DNA polymerase-3 subunit beta